MIPLSINSIAHTPIVKKDGTMTDDFRILLFRLLAGQADQLHPVNGISLPQQITTEIAKIDPAKNTSRILYDSTLQRHVAFQAGAIKKFVME
ncbi:hypothetical protein UFOVP733_54 [uncultured Caudovirales phage]|uniref:Uncharacterized protein n=1 Tax=uncultured Caudovirales phage TaxID=2100421 RepID=A0A6J7XB10_9CAUD|nr:hypothetical protein UFOVP733_54 [uncultured Caudovirales phage]CAB5224784.1 hypothetical protein UFOVP743_5 [uncultured Caudovirales phage]